MQLDTPELMAYFPGLHETHEKECVLLADRKYLPLVQVVPTVLHVSESVGSYVSGVSSLNLPVGQGLHSDTLGLMAYVPGAHGKQL